MRRDIRALARKHLQNLDEVLAYVAVASYATPPDDMRRDLWLRALAYSTPAGSEFPSAGLDALQNSSHGRGYNNQVEWAIAKLLKRAVDPDLYIASKALKTLWFYGVWFPEPIMKKLLLAFAGEGDFWWAMEHLPLPMEDRK